MSSRPTPTAASTATRSSGKSGDAVGPKVSAYGSLATGSHSRLASHCTANSSLSRATIRSTNFLGRHGLGNGP